MLDSLGIELAQRESLLFPMLRYKTIWVLMADEEKLNYYWNIYYISSCYSCLGCDVVVLLQFFTVLDFEVSLEMQL